jgi:hypothetical protein
LLPLLPQLALLQPLLRKCYNETITRRDGVVVVWQIGIHGFLLVPFFSCEPTNSFTGSALKGAVSSESSLKMVTGMGINGFGRIGRYVTYFVAIHFDEK